MEKKLSLKEEGQMRLSCLPKSLAITMEFIKEEGGLHRTSSFS